MSAGKLSKVKLNKIYRDAIIFSLIAISLIEVFYYFRGVPIRENVLDWLIGAGIAVTLMTYIFRRVGGVYSELEMTGEALQFEHRQLISIFDSIDEPIYVADIETYELLYANRALQERFGKHIVGKACYEALQRNQPSPCSFCSNSKISKNGVIQSPSVYESQNTLDGRWYRCIDKAIRWPDGRVVRFELAMDITESREADMALRSSEEKYRKLVERANDGIVIIQDEVLKFANKRFLGTYGFELNAVMGKNFREFVAPEFLETLTERYYKRMAGEPVPDIYETRLLDVNGKIVDVEINATLIDYDGGKGDLVIVRDITERKRMEERERRFREQLARSEQLATIGRLISETTHDLNNPLAIVVGYSQLLQSKLEDEALKKYVSAIVHGADRASKVVSKLLSFARDGSFKEVEVNINEVIEGVLGLREQRIEALKIQVFKDLASPSPRVPGNPDKLWQAFLDIVLNSEQAMENHEGARNLRVLSSVTGDKANVEIESSGRDMSQGNLQEAFDSSDQTAGGLGSRLSVSYKLIREQGGKIKAENRPEGGVRFTVELPLKVQGRVQPDPESKREIPSVIDT